MMSSFLVSLALLVLARNGVQFTTHKALLITIAVTTVCWVATAYLAPQTDRDVLVAFYLKTRPAGPGWAPIRRDPRVVASHETGAVENIPMAILGWVSGCTLVWSALFTHRQFPLRPHRRRNAAARRERGERPHGHLGGAHALGRRGREPAAGVTPITEGSRPGRGAGDAHAGRGRPGGPRARRRHRWPTRA